MIKYIGINLRVDLAFKKLFDVEETKELLINLLNNMNFTEDERESYEARLKWLRDEEMVLKQPIKRKSRN